ncbi:hypothetical protein BDY19DRAFT_469249 [Irpex rosettiformis]|uniref:Uncharacterized protein n=1 Tax=Irpex rosettiformis TaxID=378272 RepID=A0ACB8TSJ5_9APHY|nr:hypothetical protein BDY19DRAFT_469249 [Irpex rosettiformis]
MSASDIAKDNDSSAQTSPVDYWRQCLTTVDIEWLRSSINADETRMRARVDEIRKEAYDFSHYPCIRAYFFAKVDVVKNSIYKEIVEAGKKGDTIYLDFGCCMGTDARKLVADGYPPQNVFACDLYKELLDFGYRLYDDASTCQIHFLSSDAFSVPYPAPPSGPSTVEDLSEVTEISQLQGKVTHLYAGFFFHMFNEEKQCNLALRFGVLMKREPGTILYGRQIGSYEAGFVDALQMFAHSPESWKKMWKRAFMELESTEFAENRVIVEAEFAEVLPKELSLHGHPMPVLHWNVRIV